jgi:pimeloyl-ACP methyl ester carboxylesterase
MAARLAAALVTAAALAVAAVPAGASQRFAPCLGTQDLECIQVAVPIDRSGVVPGTISLRVARLPALGAQRGVVFLLAGGPGQAAAPFLAQSAPYFRGLLPGYTIVAVDPRGTGESGLLRCPAYENGTATSDWGKLITQCSDEIGPDRQFFSTRDQAGDLDSVRAALGLQQVALFGLSYGTKLAVAYALLHPDHVDRILLDSVLRTDRPDPLDLDFYRDLPGILASYCPGRLCRAATPSFPADVFALANRMAVKPLTAAVRQPNGTVKRVEMRAEQIFWVLSGTDVDAGLAAELPAAVRAARLARPLPLVRLLELQDHDPVFPPHPELYSPAMNLATLCADGPFPWSADTPVEQRGDLLRAAVAALPSGSFAPFGDWVKRTLGAVTCSLWPAPTGQATLPAGPLPDVPVLALGGALDLRTPANDAARTARLFPRGKALIVPGVGHGVVGRSQCIDQAVHAWLDGKPVPARCPPVPREVAPLAAFPTAVSGKASPQSTLTLVGRTIREAEAIWSAFSGQRTITCLAAGRLVSAADRTSLTLVRYGIVPGVEASGTLTLVRDSSPLAFLGTIRVSGRAAAHGKVHVSGATLTGTLAGTRVRAR